MASSVSPRDRKSVSRSASRSVSRRSYSRSKSRTRSRSGGRGSGSEKRVVPKPSRCLGVFGLSEYTSEKDLDKVFGKFGKLSRIKVITDMHRSSRGFAFIYFEHQEDADEAKEAMNGKVIDGRCIRVDYSITQKPHSPTPGVYMGKVSRSRNGGYRRYRSRSRSREYRRRRSYSRSPSYRRRR